MNVYGIRTYFRIVRNISCKILNLVLHICQKRKNREIKLIFEIVSFVICPQLFHFVTDPQVIITAYTLIIQQILNAANLRV